LALGESVGGFDLGNESVEVADTWFMGPHLNASEQRRVLAGLFTGGNDPDRNVIS
jgi:hypothetical protein